MAKYTAVHIASATDDCGHLYVYECKCKFIIGLDANWINDNGELCVTCPACGDILCTGDIQ